MSMPEGRERIRVLQDVIRRFGRTRLRCPDTICHAVGGRLILKRANSSWFWGCTRYWDGCRQRMSADQQTGEPRMVESLPPRRRTAPAVFFPPVMEPAQTRVMEPVRSETRSRKRRSARKTQPLEQTWDDAVTPARRRIILEN